MIFRSDDRLLESNASRSYRTSEGILAERQNSIPAILDANRHASKVSKKDAALHAPVGSPACFHPVIPPIMTWTLGKPACMRICAAVCARPPALQIVTILRLRCESNSASRWASAERSINSALALMLRQCTAPDPAPPRSVRSAFSCCGLSGRSVRVCSRVRSRVRSCSLS